MSDSHTDSPDLGQSLEGWKAIASYLNRDVRTAKRWEASEGLPIHRHRHSARSSVYAFPTELDTWRAGRQTEARTSAPSDASTTNRIVALSFVLLAAVPTSSSGPIAAPRAIQPDIRETFRKVWAGSGRISRDGRGVANIDQSGNVVWHDLSTGQQRRLTEGASYAGSFAGDNPILSPDGRQVAYYWLNLEKREAPRPEIRVVHVDSAVTPGSRSLLTVNGDLLPFDWSLDGKWIAASSQVEIGVIAVETGAWHKLKALVGRPPTAMFFSPDSRYLAYDAPAAKPADPHDIFVLAVDGSAEIAAVVHPGQDEVAGWSPDGTQLLFTSDRTGSVGLWALGFLSGKPEGTPRLMRAGLGLGRSLGVGASGELFMRLTLPDRDVQIATVDLASGRQTSSPVRPIDRFVGSNQQPVWSPDGRYLAYVSYRGTTFPVIGIRDDATGDVRELRPEVPHIRGLSWTPDGKAFVAGGFDLQDRGATFQIDAASGAVMPIPVTTRIASTYPQVSPDGRRLYYLRPKTTGPDSDIDVIERDLPSGRERSVLTGDLGGYSLSPDGHWIAAVRDRQSIAIAPTGQGAVRTLTPGAKSSPQWNRIAWTPDSRAVIMKANSGTDRELWLLPIDGAPGRRLDVDVSRIAPPAEGGLALHNDGRRLAFVSGDTGSEIWVLENFSSFLSSPRR